MILLANSLANVSRGAKSQPCTFKALWFNDNPFLLASGNEADALVLILRFAYAAAQWARYCLFSASTVWLSFLISLRVHLLGFQATTLCVWTQPKIGELSLRRSASRTKPNPDVDRLHHLSITGLPVEIRLKVLEHLIAEDTVVKAVGYSDGRRNLFRVTETGKQGLVVKEPLLACIGKL